MSDDNDSSALAEDLSSDDMLNQDPDYIALRRFGNSLTNLEKRYPDGRCPPHIAASALRMTEAEMEERYLEIVGFLRARLDLPSNNE